MKRFSIIGALYIALAPFAASAESAAQTIADGLPWAATLPGDRTVEMTFFPDGSMDVNAGLLSPRMSWTPTENGMCLEGGPGGTQCVFLQPTDTGFVGMDGDNVTLILAR
ncbi:hypothetical protein [Pseudaestuariivita rosea]|uniref:hypothetical protein n=1 Tax=Pseudaestuariivita rosea TaxID=2763263 RepID=UPI001ABB70D8|nr:hypothetical protein [Pseudaestuariivita rosea]